MYYLEELLDTCIPCIIVTPLLVKMLGILCIIISLYNDWFNDLSNILNRIDNQIKNPTHLDDICLAGVIRELCEARESGIIQFVDRNQICNMIDMLCTR